MSGARYGIGAICVMWGVLLAGCHDGLKDLEDIPFEPTPYAIKDPTDFTPMLIPEDNPMTAEGVALGRMLFYDPILSRDSTVSCATCHHADKAFTDGLPVSAGFGGRLGKRSALSLQNVGYFNTGLFWDGRSATLEEQSLHPVADSVEMASSWPEAERKLRDHAEYPALFRKAFGIAKVEEINRTTVGKALAQFERTLISADSRYDKVMRGAVRFTESERRGRQIFFDAEPGVLPTGECGHCHQPPMFSGLEYFNNGIDEIRDLTKVKDKGRGAVTGSVFDNGKFRSPSLRNIALTAPYMHDGRFQTLRQVIDHYNEGGHYAENASPNVRLLHFSERDKADLTAFLLTLTDTAFVRDPRFIHP